MWKELIKMDKTIFIMSFFNIFEKPWSTTINLLDVFFLKL